MKLFKKEGLLYLLVCILLVASIINAHEGEEEEQHAGDFAIRFTPSQVIQQDSIPLEVSISKDNAPMSNLQVTFTIDNHDIGLSEKLNTEEREPGHYFAKYLFKNAGPHEVHIEFNYEGELIRKTAPIDVLKKENLFNLKTILMILVIILLIIIWYSGLKGKKKNIKRSITLSVILLIAAGVAYSLYVTFTSGAAQSGIIVCPSENECYWTAHVHTYVPIKVCGEDVRLPIEKGSLAGPHTHEEKNIIHWHERLLYDKNTQKLVDATPLTLGAFFDAIEVQFTEDSILDKKNNDQCLDNTGGTLKMFVNGKYMPPSRDHVWKDREVIYFVFDSSNPSEIEKEISENPIGFPSLGRG